MTFDEQFKWAGIKLALTTLNKRALGSIYIHQSNPRSVSLLGFGIILS